MEDPIFLIHINKLNMICPYCHQEHPDNTQYCPQTGRKIQDKKLPARKIRIVQYMVNLSYLQAPVFAQNVVSQ